MPRKLRLEYSGAIYHVMNRGDPRETHSSQGAGEGLMQQRLFQRRQRRLLLLVEAREALGFDGEGRPCGLPQRGKGIQPRVARNELPWEIVQKNHQPHRGCSDRQPRGGCNPVGVGSIFWGAYPG